MLIIIIPEPESTKIFYKPNLIWYWNNPWTDTLIILTLLLGGKKRKKSFREVSNLPQITTLAKRQRQIPNLGPCIPIFFPTNHTASPRPSCLSSVADYTFSFYGLSEMKAKTSSFQGYCCCGSYQTGVTVVMQESCDRMVIFFHK